MEAFKKVKGLVVPLDRTNVDTDAIIPKQFLKRIERSGFGKFLFYELRYSEDGQLIEDSVFNKPRYEEGQILLARANFGCGSSREHAPWALADYGFKVIIAPSFADIFYNNCFNNGILPIVLDNNLLNTLFENTTCIDGYQLEIDLTQQTIKDHQGLNINFEIDAYKKHKLLNGLDDIGLTLLKENKITDYEMNHYTF
jgi:3-isopropylmalate/(R)-2-methylmalate dehydratase small subunit